jgi:hypothetical protein
MLSPKLTNFRFSNFRWVGQIVSVQLTLTTIWTHASEPASLPREAAIGQQLQQHYSMDDYDKIIKIDAHVHANTKDVSFLEQAKLDNFMLLSVNVDYPDFPSLATQQKVVLYLKERHPQRFNFAATFSMKNWQSPNWLNHKMPKPLKLGKTLEWPTENLKVIW